MLEGRRQPVSQVDVDDGLQQSQSQGAGETVTAWAVELRPVFTAHPTEVSRRSVQGILRRVADVLDQDLPEEPLRRRLARLVDLLWQTDEIRPGKPTVLDEASAVAYYLEQLGTHAVPDLLEDLETELARASFTLPPRSCPVVLGCWVGGDRDGNPNVSQQVTLDVLRLYADRALKIQLALVAQLIEELSVSTRVVGVSEDLRRSLAHDRCRLPDDRERDRCRDAQHGLSLNQQTTGRK